MHNTMLKLGKGLKNMVILDTGSIKDPACEEFAKAFPERYFVFGLAESNMISAAAGFAIAGKMPVVFGSARFLLSAAFDQVYNDICIPNLNVKIVGLVAHSERSEALASGDEEVDKDLVKILPNMKITDGGIAGLEKMLEEYGPGYLLA